MIKIKDFLDSNYHKESRILPLSDSSSAMVIKQKHNYDNRGQFTRIYDLELIRESISDFVNFSQISFSHNLEKGTLRGLHVQSFPSVEAKLVKVIQGSIIDYLIDLNPLSKNYLKLQKIHLTEKDECILLVPPAHAHGILTLEPNTILSYAMNAKYDPSRDVSISMLRSSVNFDFPIKINQISSKDSAAMTLEECIKKYRFGN